MSQPTERILLVLSSPIALFSPITLFSPIENVISSAGAPLLTNIFLVVLVGVFIFAVVCQKLNKLPGLTIYTPTLLTSLGMLGTFMGIVSGLLAFDTINIDTSIGPLLDGLKTAFITSLAGMSLSIIYKTLSVSGALAPNVTYQTTTDKDVTAADLYAIMVQQNNAQKRAERQLEQVVETLAGISTATQQQQAGFQAFQEQLWNKMEGFAEISQATTLQMANALTRIDGAVTQQATQQQAGFKAFETQLWERLQEFADMMSRSATEQVVEALKMVIQDFNNNLTEQFGDNFKQLNSAVIELVVWQENYKQQLSAMKVQYDHGVQAITRTESAVAHIGEKTESIPVAMDALVKVMEVNQHQINELARHLEGFAQVRDKAVAAVPEISGQIDLVVRGAREANQTMAKSVIESAGQLQQVVTESAENYRVTVDQTRLSLADVATTTADSSIAIKEQFGGVVTDINMRMGELASELQMSSLQLVDGLRQGNTELRELNERLIADIRSGNQVVSTSFNEAANDVTENTRKMVSSFSTAAGDNQQLLMETIELSVRKQCEMIENNMVTEVTRVMQAMGDALATISGQFVKDYSKMTKMMSDVDRRQAS